MTLRRVVLDTNVCVSRFLRPHSTPGRAVETAWVSTHTLISVPTWWELREVLNRPKFAPYAQPELIDEFLRKVLRISENVLIPTPIRACGDPRDDKFVELAVHGRADFIVSGDQDLLLLNPFQGIAIVTPAEFLAHVTEAPGAKPLS